MKNLEVLQSTEGKEYWFEVKGLKLQIPYHFDAYLDLAHMKYYAPFEEPEGAAIKVDLLVANGLGAFKFGYEIHNFRYKSENPKVDVNKVIEFFKEKGFNVTKTAIQHNYEAWQRGFKSGFLDEKNGYHLFTPCGANPLRFTLTSLCSVTDWQTTYEC